MFGSWLTFYSAQQIVKPVNGIKRDVENIIDGRFKGWWTIEHDKKESFEWEKRMVKSYNSICLGKKISEKDFSALCVLLD